MTNQESNIHKIFKIKKKLQIYIEIKGENMKLNRVIMEYGEALE